MARLLLKALGLAGHAVQTVSSLRSFSKAPDAERLASLEQASAREIDAILIDWQKANHRPELWLTYHPYYKAPDLIGPELASRLGIPYVTIEASHAAKRTIDAWRPWQAHVERALGSATLNIAMTARDRDGIARYFGSEDRIAMLQPFIDMSTPALRRQMRDGIVVLVTVAMMRSGDKLKSYEFLAEALSSLQDLDWRLHIIGDGPARQAVEQAFEAIPPQKLVWHGELSQSDVAAHLPDGDLYLWPGFNEAYGLAYLEAQAAGLPVVALDTGGIASVVQDGRTGLLIDYNGIAEQSLDSYRSAIMTLIEDRPLRRKLAQAASDFIASERTIEIAAGHLDGMLRCAANVHSAAIDA